jgi:hypothetical protein
VKVQAGHWRAGWLRHRDLPDPRHTQQAGLLYFNGGGYICGGLNTHRRLVAKLAHASRIPAFKVDYRQLPHAHITDTLDDAVEAYRYLLGFGPKGSSCLAIPPAAAWPSASCWPPANADTDARHGFAIDGRLDPA